MSDSFNIVRERLVGIVGAQNAFINEPMKKHTSFRTGGNADLLITPGSPEEVSASLRVLKSGGTPYYVMGNGTNLLVGDNGYRGVIVKIGGKMSGITVNGDEITADAGALLSSVSRVAYENGLAGLEFAEGIPGTVGGAAAMNAGAYGGEIKGVIKSAVVFDVDGNTIMLSRESMELGYRTSIIEKRGMVCLSALFALEKGDKDDIKGKMDANRASRIEKQPIDKPSAGSTFKRPEGYFAGKLISDSGLKGYRIGGAEVSEKHAGFIINAGGASSADILGLIRYVQKTVYEKYGVRLETEVKILGD